MTTKVLVWFIMILLAISSSFGALYYQSYNTQYYFTLDRVDNSVYPYNYREANKASDRYEDQFEFDEDNYYNVYNTRQGFRMNPGYAVPRNKVYDPNVKNRWRD